MRNSKIQARIQEIDGIYTSTSNINDLNKINISFNININSLLISKDKLLNLN